MMKRLYRYIYLNIYTLALDGCFIVLAAAIIAGLVCASIIVPALICAIPAFLLLKTVIRLHRSTREKYRSLDRLNEINKEAFDPQSYENFMNAPCTRQVVRLSLRETGRPESYKRLKEQYQRHFFVPKRGTEFRIVIHDNERPE